MSVDNSITPNGNKSGQLIPSINQINTHENKEIQKARILIATGNDITYVAIATGLPLETIIKIKQEENR